VEGRQAALRKKILAEMTVDYSNLLEKNFDLAKQFVRLLRDGSVELLVKDKLGGKEQILLYLMGKLYSKEAGLATTFEVGNAELMDQLGMPIGSLLPFLKDLRDANKVRQVKREKNVYHSLPPGQIEETLTALERKVRKE